MPVMAMLSLKSKMSHFPLRKCDTYYVELFVSCCLREHQSVVDHVDVFESTRSDEKLTLVQWDGNIL